MVIKTTKITQLFLATMLLISADVAGQFFFLPAKDFGNAELVATYAHKFHEDSLNLTHSRHLDMFLMLGKNTSRFISANWYLNNQEGRMYEQQGRLTEYLNLPSDRRYRSRFTYSIYKNYPAGKILFRQRVGDNHLQYEEDMNIFSWELSNETSIVSGYQVQKASVEYGGRKWIAWYCADLPYSDGPYKFRGLPGLIVHLYDTQKHYEFELVHIGKPEKETLIELDDRPYISTSKRDFFKAEDNYRENIISHAKKAGLSSSSQQTAARNIAKRNNPIELDRNPVK